MVRSSKLVGLASAVMLILAVSTAQAGLVLERVMNNSASTAVPGTTGGEQWVHTTSAFDSVRVANNGDLFFSGTLNTAGSVTNSNKKGVWYGAPSAWQLIARDGTAGPTLSGGPTGWVHNSTTVPPGIGLVSSPLMSPNGTMFINSLLNGPGAFATNNYAFWTGQAGSLAIVAQRGYLPTTGGVAPGTGGLLWNFNIGSEQLRVNDSGQTLFYSTLLPIENVNLGSLVSDGTTVTATTSTPHNYTAGVTTVILAGSTNGYNGAFVVQSVSGTPTNQFTYTYTPISRSVTSITVSFGTATATTSVAHGFVANDCVNIVGATPPEYNGTFVISQVPSTTTFKFTTAATVSASGTITASSPVAPLAGTASTAGTSSTGYVTSLVGNGPAATATVTTANAHGYVAGVTIVNIAGATPSGFNGAYLVQTVTSATEFTYTNSTNGPATGRITVTSGAITTAGAYANDNGIWLGSPSGIVLVARRNDPAPPPIVGAFLDSVDQYGNMLNNLGSVCKVSKLKTTVGLPLPTANNDQVLWTGTPGSLTCVAREGDVVPAGLGLAADDIYATGDPLTLMTNGGFSNDNTVYYSAKIIGSDVTTGVNDYILIRYNASSIPPYSKVVRRGDATPAGIPGLPVDATFDTWNFNNTRVSNTGSVLLAIIIKGTGVTSADNNTLWVKPAIGPAVLVVRQNDLIGLPDLPADARFNLFSISYGVAFNNLDQVAFQSQFNGTGIVSPVNDNGVFAWDPVGGLMLAAQRGNKYDTSLPYPQGVATGVSFDGWFNGSGSSSGLSDTGWLALKIQDNYSNQAIFRTKVVAQGACCYVDGTPCAMTTAANCPTNLGALWHSDWTSCQTCPPVGRCCYIDGGCAVRFQENCTGVWTQGLDCNTTCPVLGACCDVTTGLCSFVPEAICMQSPSNIWHLGQICNDVQCLGSCCDLTYGTCMISLWADCPSPGVWTLGGTCNPNPCAQPTGSCCLTDGTCQDAKTRLECEDLGSVRWTPAATCPTSCPLPPSLIKTGLANSYVSPDGQTVTGSVYQGDTQTSTFRKYTRGTGYVTINGEPEASYLRCTNAGSIMASAQKDLTNLSGLNDATHIRTLAKRWTANTWSYLGATGVPAGAAGCDYTINNCDGLSDDGRYIAASGWSGSSCGPFRIWRWDNTGATWAQLPNIGTQDRAYGMSGDGNYVVGWDQTGQYRNAAVWRYYSSAWTCTVLDNSPAQSEIYGVDDDGRYLVGNMSPAGMTTAFGNPAQTPVRWTRVGNTATISWIRTNLGGVDGMIPLAVSNDGNTVVGVGGTASDAWIWKPTLAAPMDLQEYLLACGANPEIINHITMPALLSRGISGMSRDGNAIVATYLHDDPCLVTGGGMIVYLTGVPCEPPRIVYHPVSQDYTTPPPFGGILNCLVGGSLQLTYQWQKLDPATQIWNNLEDDNCSSNNGKDFQVMGAHTAQLRIGWLDMSNSSGTYRCVVNSGGDCGSVTSNPATLRFGGACCLSGEICQVAWQTNSNPLGCAELGGTYQGNYTTCTPNPCLLGDMNCDGVRDGLDIQHFVQALIDPVGYTNDHDGSPYPNCNILKGDMNYDTFVDINDIPDFVYLLVNP